MVNHADAPWTKIPVCVQRRLPAEHRTSAGIDANVLDPRAVFFILVLVLVDIGAIEGEREVAHIAGAQAIGGTQINTIGVHATQVHGGVFYKAAGNARALRAVDSQRTIWSTMEERGELGGIAEDSRVGQRGDLVFKRDLPEVDAGCEVSHRLKHEPQGVVL